MRKTVAGVAGAAALAAGFIGAAPALAAGCNGVVEWWTWGCAGWDNNNGPNYKYYKKSVVSVPIPKSGGLPVEVKDNQAYATVNGVKMPIAGGVPALVASGGGNLVASGGGNLVASGGGNLSVIKNGS